MRPGAPRHGAIVQLLTSGVRHQVFDRCSARRMRVRHGRAPERGVGSRGLATLRGALPMHRDAQFSASVSSAPPELLSELAAALQSLPAGNLRMAFPELSTDEAQRWEREFAPLRHPCGCQAAALGLIVSVGLGGLAYYAAPTLRSASWTAFLVSLGACAIAGLLAGKSLGIARARRRYLRLVSRFHDEVLGLLNQRTRPGHEAAGR